MVDEWQRKVLDQIVRYFVVLNVVVIYWLKGCCAVEAVNHTIEKVTVER